MDRALDSGSQGLSGRGWAQGSVASIAQIRPPAQTSHLPLAFMVCVAAPSLVVAEPLPTADNQGGDVGSLTL